MSHRPFYKTVLDLCINCLFFGCFELAYTQCSSGNTDLLIMALLVLGDKWVCRSLERLGWGRCLSGNFFFSKLWNRSFLMGLKLWRWGACNTIKGSTLLLSACHDKESAFSCMSVQKPTFLQAESTTLKNQLTSSWSFGMMAGSQRTQKQTKNQDNFWIWHTDAAVQL